MLHNFYYSQWTIVKSHLGACRSSTKSCSTRRILQTHFVTLCDGFRDKLRSHDLTGAPRATCCQFLRLRHKNNGFYGRGSLLDLWLQASLERLNQKGIHSLSIGKILVTFWKKYSYCQLKNTPVICKNNFVSRCSKRNSTHTKFHANGWSTAHYDTQQTFT